jgi:S-adenosylmethionine:tRNA ribosyltransferase-isomerase
MLVSDFSYHLPPELIAQEPVAQRDQSRLLVLRRADGSLAHHLFGDLPAFLRNGDLLVLNDTRVLRARLRGHKTHGGGRIEILLGEELGPNDWWVMLRPGKRVRIGTTLSFPRPGRVPIQAVVREKDAEGLCRLLFEGIDDLNNALDEIGEVPLPPYIERPDTPTGHEMPNVTRRSTRALPERSPRPPRDSISRQSCWVASNDRVLNSAA